MAEVQPTSRGRQPPRGRVRGFLSMLGPGLITGASDDDPSGIATYAAAGARLGYAPLWTSLLTLPLNIGVQFVCAQIGLVTGRGLAGVLRHHYSPAVIYPAVAGLLLCGERDLRLEVGTERKAPGGVAVATMFAAAGALVWSWI
ncbi:MAG: divalent metal cation transporter [Gemmatimonadetes bacterium]|nr:divalent metal cation transporter [Gemmatimonadota bacterium]